MKEYKVIDLQTYGQTIEDDRVDLENVLNKYAKLGYVFVSYAEDRLILERDAVETKKETFDFGDFDII